MTNLRDDVVAVLSFLGTLSTREWRDFTSEDIEKIALFTESDGCTGVIDFYADACIIHDFYYRTHRDFYGNPISKDAADKGLRDSIRAKSWMGKFSPMAWWRWRGVKHLADKAWG